MSLEYFGSPIIGATPGPTEAEIAARRVAEARRVKLWREIDDTCLVKRGPWLLDTTTDQLCRVYNGHVFGGKGQIESGADQPLLFAVDHLNNIRLFEQVGRTWTQVLEDQERNKAATR